MWHLRSPARIITLAVCAAACPAAASAQQSDAAVLQQHATAGERALAEGRYVDAENEYETLRKLSPGTAEVHARRRSMHVSD